jgi:hypothetical protein
MLIGIVRNPHIDTGLRKVMPEDQIPDSEEYLRFKRFLTALVAVPKSEIYDLAPKLKPKAKKKRTKKKSL